MNHLKLLQHHSLHIICRNISDSVVRYDHGNNGLTPAIEQAMRNISVYFSSTFNYCIAVNTYFWAHVICQINRHIRIFYTICSTLTMGRSAILCNRRTGVVMYKYIHLAGMGPERVCFWWPPPRLLVLRCKEHINYNTTFLVIYAYTMYTYRCNVIPPIG